MHIGIYGLGRMGGRMARRLARRDHTFAERIVSALRHAFGGHGEAP